jgi:hypothetical protein
LLPLGHNHILFAEPLDGLVTLADFGDALETLCPQTDPPLASFRL